MGVANAIARIEILRWGHKKGSEFFVQQRSFAGLSVMVGVRCHAAWDLL
jgi:hypothetical protein